MQPPHQRESSSRSRNSNPRTAQAKGLALELKNLLKLNEPWDRQVEIQRDATRKAYLKIIFSSPSLTASSLALLSSSTSRSSSLLHSSSSTHSQSLEALNLLWLDTSHLVISLYRSKLSKLEKQIAENPKPPSRKERDRDRRGGNDGQIQLPPPPAPPQVGPVAKRKLLNQFQGFLSKEEEFWRILVNRLSSRLTKLEQLELRPLGILPTNYDDHVNTSSQSQEEEEVVEVSEEEKKKMRLQVLPLVFKSLICFGDLNRYIEYHSDVPITMASSGGAGGGSGGRGGRRGKKNVGRGEKGGQVPVKTYTKAAECYRQAKLLLPDDGNSHNQLAVLSQYTSEPLSSIYHYYRALTTKNPFKTATKNLEIAFGKSMKRYFEEGGKEAKNGEQRHAFGEAFIVLHGLFYTKTRLSELSTISTKVDRLFEECTRERLITSDGVLKVVVTALAALWHARLARSKILNDNSALNLSRTKTTSLADSTTAAPQSPSVPKPAETGPKLEPHILLHLLHLYTTLLSLSSIETNELYSSNLESLSSSSSSQIPLNSNISAVLRRSIPGLRIMGRWLKGNLEYIDKIEKRVEEKERKRLKRKLRNSGGSSMDKSSQEEAQRSFESSGGKSEEDGTPIVGTQEISSAIDKFWTAFADYSNSIKLAFPRGGGGVNDALPVLEEGNWLEEDVECLGFAPLRQRGGSASAKEGARRVGRDVHPNQEVLMRVEEGQRLADEIAESPISRIALVDGAFVFVPKGTEFQVAEVDEVDTEEPLKDSEIVAEDEEAEDEDNNNEEPEEDSEMRDQSTEDDPVDRAMRLVGAADELDMEDEDEDDEEEEIVFSGSRQSSQPPAVVAPPPVQPSATPGFPSRQGSLLTAADLRQRLFAPSPLPAEPSFSSPPAATPPRSTSQPPSTNYVPPSLFVPSTGSPSSSSIPSIWGAPPPLSHSQPHPHSNLSGPSLLPQNHQPMTPHSFESIPNLTHSSLAAHQFGWQGGGNAQLPPPPHSSAQPPSIPPTQLFGGHPAFALPHAPTSSRSYSQPNDSPYQHQSPHHRLPPPPGLSTAHVGLSPAPMPMRMNSNGTAMGTGLNGSSGFGFALPPPRESGGWPSHLGGGSQGRG